jgi:hypothetical protein
MTSPLERIESHSQEAKRLIGIRYEDFILLVTLAEQKHQVEIEKNKIRLIAPGGGWSAEMTVKEGICLCLVYLRQKPTFEILGLLFSVSRSKRQSLYWRRTDYNTP